MIAQNEYLSKVRAIGDVGGHCKIVFHGRDRPYFLDFGQLEKKNRCRIRKHQTGNLSANWSYINFKMSNRLIIDHAFAHDGTNMQYWYLSRLWSKLSSQCRGLSFHEMTQSFDFVFSVFFPFPFRWTAP